jgi:hypothetical protein
MRYILRRLDANCGADSIINTDKLQKHQNLIILILVEPINNRIDTLRIHSNIVFFARISVKACERGNLPPRNHWLIDETLQPPLKVRTHTPLRPTRDFRVCGVNGLIDVYVNVAHLVRSAVGKVGHLDGGEGTVRLGRVCVRAIPGIGVLIEEVGLSYAEKGLLEGRQVLVRITGDLYERWV